MIVEMSRVLVLGPKRLLGQVIDEVQRLGMLHVDRIESEEAPEVTALQLGEEDTKTLQALERALARADGLLVLLPPGSAEPGDAPGDAAIDALDAEVAEIERRVRDLTRKRLELDEERQLIASFEGAVRLLSIRAWLADRLAQMKVIPELAQSRYAFILYGWAPTRAVSEVRGVLRSRFGSDIVVHGEPVDAHDEPERIPVLLDNHPLIRPFQRLLALFQPPRYGAFDPSPVMAVTFPIFVGLVIGDIGYGLLLLLLGWWLRGRARSGHALSINFLSMRFPPLLLADLSYLLRVLAFWVILFGTVYAELFGNLPELLFHVEPLYDRVHQADSYFIVVIIAGILMIFFGLLVHLVQAVRHRHTVGVFESIVLMLGTSGLLLFLRARGGRLPAGLSQIGLYLFLAAVVVALGSRVVDRDVIKRFLWLVELQSGSGPLLSHASLMP